MHSLRPGFLQRLVLASLIAGFASACVTRPAKQEVYKDGDIEIYLRSDVVWTNTVDKGYGHPVTIAPVRIAHILSRIDLRPSSGALISFGGKKDRVPAIETDMLYSIAEGVSKALSQADENQEVVVIAIDEKKNWGVFDHDFLTSFVSYVRDDRLYVHLSRYAWEIPKGRDERVPEPRADDHPQRFKLYTGTAMSLVNDQSLAIDWRDPVFARPTRTRVLPGGDVVRKTILEESPPEVDEQNDPLERVPDDLSPQQLRDLADVEEARREGRITEVEYRTRRREILGP